MYNTAGDITTTALTKTGGTLINSTLRQVMMNCINGNELYTRTLMN